MIFTDFITLLEKTPAYKDWKCTHQKSYLCSFFKIFDEDKDTNIEDNWQVDLYDKNTDEITSFVIAQCIATKLEQSSKVFKEKHKIVEKLSLDKVSVNIIDALRIVEEAREKEYSDHHPTKKILILQQQAIPLWNISYITSSLQLLNFKINATTGEIISHGSQSVLSFRQK